MKTIAVSIFASSHLLLAINLAHASCSHLLRGQINSAQHAVDSLRPDKPGQTRVTAFDGSEYTAVLGGVSDLLLAHRRT
jgi:hypothetical protein